MKTIKYTIIVCLFFFCVTSFAVDDKLQLNYPTLTYEEAIHHMENIFDKEADLKKYILEDIIYDYITGEWSFYYNMIQGSHFIIIMDDKDPTKYRGIGGA